MTERALSPEAAAPREPLGRFLWRGGVLASLTAMARALSRTPPGRWLQRRIQGSLELTTVDVPLCSVRGGGELLSLAYLSDLHATYFMDAGDLERLARAVMERAPDLVCLGGDLVHSRAVDIQLYERALERLRPPLGVFAVPGNHEYNRPGVAEACRRFLEARGVRVLVNRGARVEKDGRTFWIAGVDDLWEGQPDLWEALAGRRPGEPAILLSHHPDLFIESSALGVDLQLSGHTHGGQIRIFGWAPLTHTRHGFVSGLYERGGARLYVGRGAGVTALPVRIGTRSEVTFLRLRGG